MPLSLDAWWIMLRQMSRSWLDDYALSMGAALAYYTLFSLAPLLLIVIAVAGLVFGEDAARGEISAQLRSLMGEGGAQAVQGLLASVHKPAEGVAATVLGAVGRPRCSANCRTRWTASGGHPRRRGPEAGSAWFARACSRSA